MMSANQLPSCRVLYVDDTREDQQILREAISFAVVPVELVTASTAKSALELLRDGSPFHVLLLDWNLPVVTGAEFLTTLRDTHPLLPVIILTGEPRTVDALIAAKLRATIVKKPLFLEDWEKLAADLYQHCEVAHATASAVS
jgi:CheY-like chemotaxis protein